MNIILLGYRGCGKSTLGKALAERLGLGFVDVDEVVRGRFLNMTIAQIWEEHGEPAFRQAEVEATLALLKQENQVVALGGGTVMQHQAKEAILMSDAKRIYLAASPEVLASRLAGDANTQTQRPSLTGEQSAVEEVRLVLSQRDAVYREVATKVINVGELSIDEAIEEMVKYAHEKTG